MIRKKQPIKKKIVKKTRKIVLKDSADLPKDKPKKPIKDSVATMYPPLTSEAQLKRTTKEQNALNRSRSKSMENRVAKVLHGRRVLLSGAAAAYKGDVEVRFNNYPGGYLVECKLSAQSKENEPHIKIKAEWFPKMHIEAKNMGSKFAVLIVNFLGNTRDFVFIRKDIVNMLIDRYHTPYADTLNALLTQTPILDTRTNKAGKTFIWFTLKRHIIESNFIMINGITGMRLMISDGEYLVIHIDSFAKIVEHL